MATLYIRLPSRAAAADPVQWTGLPCLYALVAANGRVEREASANWDEVPALARAAQRTVLLLAAGDVSLLRVKVPPLSAARLRAALPNLVEDLLITDPAECAMVAGAADEGMRTVAVVQRSWLEMLLRPLHQAGVRQLAVLPAQLCLPWQPEAVSASALGYGTNIDLALRLAPQEGLGVPVAADDPESGAREVFETIAALVPQGMVSLYVPAPALETYQAASADLEAHGERIHPHADSWDMWIAGAAENNLDLVAGMGMAGAPRLEWKLWRWPLVLGGLLLTVNLAALNYEWWRLRGEANALRATMTQIYRTAFPKETLIVDPLAQMRQKLTNARRASGEVGADDFLVLAAKFGEAWNLAGQGRAPALAGLEYKDRTLTVRIKPGAGTPTLEQIQAGLTGRDLELKEGPSQGGMTVWQIRSSK